MNSDDLALEDIISSEKTQPYGQGKFFKKPIRKIPINNRGRYQGNVNNFREQRDYQRGDNQRGDNQRGDNQRGDNQRGDNQRGDNQRGENQRGENQRGDNQREYQRKTEQRGFDQRGDYYQDEDKYKPQISSQQQQQQPSSYNNNSSTSHINHNRSSDRPTTVREQKKLLQIKKNSRPVYIKYLDINISTKDIIDIATQGNSDVKIVSVATQTEGNKQKGFKVVTTIVFENEKDGEDLIKNYNGAILEQNELKIDYA